MQQNTEDVQTMKGHMWNYVVNKQSFAHSLPPVSLCIKPGLWVFSQSVVVNI